MHNQRPNDISMISQFVCCFEWEKLLEMSYFRKSGETLSQIYKLQNEDLSTSYFNENRTVRWDLRGKSDSIVTMTQWNGRFNDSKGNKCATRRNDNQRDAGRASHAELNNKARLFCLLEREKLSAFSFNKLPLAVIHAETVGMDFGQSEIPIDFEGASTILVHQWISHCLWR